jgi:hypothetical protein
VIREKPKKGETARLAELVVQGLTEAEGGGPILDKLLRHHEDELAVRRLWAERIRREFGKYHEHSADGGECGACGAIQAANWMDPDYAEDGPADEKN